MENKEEISERTEKDYREVFSLFCQGGDKIKCNELNTYLRKLHLPVSQEEFHAIFFKANQHNPRKNNDELEFQEFFNMMTDKEVDIRDALVQIFKIYNENQKEKISSSELKLLLKFLKINEEDCNLIIQFLENGDCINYEELIDLLFLADYE